MKPFPALAPSSLGEIITYISVHRSYIYPVQEGFIPIIAAAVHLLFILSAVGRVGMNPTPTLDACNALVVSELLA